MIAQITAYAGTSAPSGFAFCDGSAIDRTTYAALFAVIGSTFGGGDSSTTFNIPDLRGRAPVGVGTGDAPDATAWALANKKGSEGVALSSAELASHSHVATTTIAAITHPSTKTNSPISNKLTVPAVATSGDAVNSYAAPGSGTDVSLASDAAATVNDDTGDGDAHANIQPSLAINFIIQLT